MSLPLTHFTHSPTHFPSTHVPTAHPPMRNAQAALSTFCCLTEGDVLTVWHGGEPHALRVTEVQPAGAGAVSVIDTDLEARTHIGHTQADWGFCISSPRQPAAMRWALFSAPFSCCSAGGASRPLLSAPLAAASSVSRTHQLVHPMHMCNSSVADYHLSFFPQVFVEVSEETEAARAREAEARARAAEHARRVIEEARYTNTDNSESFRVSRFCSWFLWCHRPRVGFVCVGLCVASDDLRRLPCRILCGV